MKKAFILVMMIAFLPLVSAASTEYTASTSTTCNNGDCTLTLYSYPVAHYDGSGFAETVLEYVASSDPLYDYEAVGSFKAFFKEDPSTAETVKFVYNQSYLAGRNPHKAGFVTFQPHSMNYRNDLDQISQINTIQGVTGAPSSNVFIYNNAFGAGLSLDYEFLHDTLKQKTWVGEFTDLPSVPQYIIDGGNPTVDVDFIIDWNDAEIDIYVDDALWDKSSTVDTTGRVEFRLGTETLWFLPAPYAEDNNGTVVSSSYRLKKQGSTLFVVLKTDYEFFNSTSTEYPVFIDPTTVLQDADTENLDDATIKPSSPGSNYGSQATLETDWDATLNEAFVIKFNLSQLPLVPSLLGSTNLDFSTAGSSTICGNAFNYSVYNVSDDSWSEDSVTWTTRPSFGDSLDETGFQAGGDVVFSSSPLAVAIANEAAGDDVISFYVNYTGACNSNQNFRSKESSFTSFRPKLTVSYTVSITMVSPTDEQALTTDSVLLNATYIGGYINETWYVLDGGANTSFSFESSDGGQGTGEANTTLTSLSDGTHTIVIYANNSGGDIASSEINRTFTVDTIAPNATLMDVNPGAAYTNSTLTCYATISDILDTSIQTYYQWYNDSEMIDSGVTTCTKDANCTVATLSSGNYTLDHNITCEVTPEDDYRNGTAVNSTALNIINSPPTVSTVTSVSQSHSINLSTNLTCVDADVTDGTQSFKYYDNTTLFNIEKTGGNISDDPVITDEGEYDINLSCSDGVVNSSVNFEYNITNAAPTVTLVSITPSPAVPAQDLTCSNTTTDADGDAITDYSVKWFVNDAENSSYNNITVIGGGNTSNGDTYVCSMRATDSQDWGSFTNSSTLQINDSTAPTVENASLSAISGVDNTPFTIYVDVNDAATIASVTVTVVSPLAARQNFSMNPGNANGQQSYLYTPTTDGTYQIVKFYATDGSGNTGTLASVLTYVESTSDPGGAGGGGGGGGVPPITEEDIIQAVVDANITQTRFCGDLICQEDIGENPATCFEDCPVNVDNLLTCLFTEGEECVYESAWFATLALWLLVGVVGYFVYLDAQKNERRKKRAR